MRTRVIGAVVAGLAAVSCSDSVRPPTSPASITVPVRFETGMHAGRAHNFRTHLTGDAERPTPVDTQAQGQAIFRLSEDGSEIYYKLIVANIENVTQAHIHCCVGTEATAGVVAWLYPSAPPARLIPGRSDGPLSEGVITAASLRGALAGQPLSTLIERIAAGLAYVNVHTSQFPGGEVRGQIE